MSRVLILFLLAISSLFSKEIEEFPFIGVTISYESSDILTTTNAINTEKNTNIGIRYGQQTVDWRSMFTYSRSNNQKFFVAEIDKILLDEIYGSPMFRPYVGLSLGAVHFDNQNFVDNTMYFYGFNAGLIIYATDNIDADLSYHYYETFDDTEVANMEGPTLSLHYFY